MQSLDERDQVGSCAVWTAAWPRSPIFLLYHAAHLKRAYQRGDIDLK